MKFSLSIYLLLLQLLVFSTGLCQLHVRESKKDIKSLKYDSKKEITFLDSPLNDSLLLVSNDHQFGIIDVSGRVLVPLVYDEIKVSSREKISIREVYLYKLRLSNEHFYEYWQNGNESEEEYALLLKQELENPMSYMNLDERFRECPVFSAERKGKWGVINKFNEMIIPFEYESINEVGYDIFLAKKEGKYGVIDMDLKIIVPFNCDTIILRMLYAHQKDELRAYGILKREGKYGLINLFNKQVRLPEYDDLEQCYDKINRSCHCGFSSYWDDASFTPKKGELKRFHSFNKLLVFKRENQYGLLNSLTMKEVTTDLYDSIRFKSRHSEIVYLNGKATFLVSNGTYLHSEVYDDVSALNRHSVVSFFKVERNKNVGVYSEGGACVVDLKWDNVISVRQGVDTLTYNFVVEKNGKFGVVNSARKTIIPVRYDSIKYTFDYRDSYYTTYKKSKMKKVSVN